MSNDGGVQPVWSEDGRELFYRSGRDLFAVPVELAPPTSLFAIDVDPRPSRWRPDYDHDLGTKRFVVARRDAESQSIRFNVILNYFEELKRLVPVR